MFVALSLLKDAKDQCSHLKERTKKKDSFSIGLHKHKHTLCYIILTRGDKDSYYTIYGALMINLCLFVSHNLYCMYISSLERFQKRASGPILDSRSMKCCYVMF